MSRKVTREESLRKAINNEQLTQDDLDNILNHTAKENDERIEHTSTTDRIMKRKGVMNYVFLKMPLRYIGISSLKQTNTTISDLFRSLRSPICPKCCSAILMYDRKLSYTDQTVDWFCADQNCDYSIRYSPNHKDIHEKIKLEMVEINNNKWDTLTESEKEELISSHLFKAIMGRNVAMVFIFIALLELPFQMFYPALITAALSFSIFIKSLSWAYRAFQIKTGKVFNKRIPFMEWVKTSEKWFSVDWCDDEANKGAQ